MKTIAQINLEIEDVTLRSSLLIHTSKTFKNERNALMARVEFLRECLQVVQILSAESIENQHEKVLEKIGKYDLAIKKANELPSKALINQNIKDAVDYYKPAQLSKQREILEYIKAD